HPAACGNHRQRRHDPRRGEHEPQRRGIRHIVGRSGESFRRGSTGAAAGRPVAMRILLASNASYFPPRGGSTRSNLVWLRQLASAGHACRVVCAAPESETGADRERAEQGITSTIEANLEITPMAELARKRGVLLQAMAEFKPDWIL